MAPTQDILIGRNFTLQLNDGLGNIIQLNRLSSFNPKPKIKELERQDMDGIMRHRDIPQGWEGDLEFSQVDDSIDAYFAVQEALYFTAPLQPYNTVLETITYAANHSVQYIYTFVILTPLDMGIRKPDEFVTPKAKFKASQRIKLK